MDSTTLSISKTARGNGVITVVDDLQTADASQSSEMGGIKRDMLWPAVYLYELRAGEYISLEKMLFVK